MKYIRSMIVAFSLYSKVPMPVFEWREEDLKHNLVFLPWVGALIGVIVYGISFLFDEMQIPLIFVTAIYSLVPLVITGGFHMDGFMDVQDALKSYGSREEKLTILKDPHIGAFAVIQLLIYCLVWAAGISLVVVSSRYHIVFYALSFFVVRCACGIISHIIPNAKKEGMLHMETEYMEYRDLVCLFVQLIIGLSIMIYINVLVGLCCVAGLAVFNLYFCKLCLREFGGVTGDTSGYYIVVAELILLLCIGACGYFGI
ncbi:MAG: adenosylcobinamide-GDP ribazoletransferase [Lachnospiraceae bacterium]|nr:adenosylcobinamide-GDP ribazoletransferase [Lachnospiraceae bacterium]